MVEALDRPVHADRLEVTRLDDSLVIYQASPERVHHLNNTASFVFELSTGQRDFEEIATEMQRAFGLAEPPADAVAQCVRDLRELGVLR